MIVQSRFYYLIIIFFRPAQKKSLRRITLQKMSFNRDELSLSASPSEVRVIIINFSLFVHYLVLFSLLMIFSCYLLVVFSFSLLAPYSLVSISFSSHLLTPSPTPSVCFIGRVYIEIDVSVLHHPTLLMVYHQCLYMPVCLSAYFMFHSKLSHS